MDFTLSDDQRDLRSATGRILEGMYPVDRLRAAFDNDVDVEMVWPRLVQQGLSAMAVPDSHGGLEWPTIDIALVHEESGFACLPEPLLEHTIASRVLAASDAAEAGPVLDAVSEQGARLSIVLPGQQLVHAAQGADHVVVCDGDDVVLVAGDDIVLSRKATFDRSRQLAAVGSVSSRRTVLGGSVLARRAVELNAVLSAAELIGLARRLLDDTVAYVKQREQFDVPIGSFQAVKHALAESFRLIEVARPAVWEAALNYEDQTHALLQPHVARALSIVAARQANECALQFHGGVGFAWENNLQFWLKRGKSLEVGYGSLEATLDTIAIGSLV